MGSVLCCSQSPSARPKTNIVYAKATNSGKKPTYVVPDTSSTSDSQTENFFHEEPSKPQKIDSFINFINQRDFQISSIQKISQISEGCSQQKTFIKHLQKLQKQLSPTRPENEPKNIEMLILQNNKTKIDMKLFIEHSTKCPICYQLFQNLKNMELQQIAKVETEGEENRISLRDSLLQFDQCQKAKRCAECKCQIMNSHEEAEKAMKKFPNTNKYQSKTLRFRKTSLFEPQIKEERQSQESN